MNSSKFLQKITCPITKEIMYNPVKGIDGLTYERSAIINILNINFKSPISQKYMTPNDLKPDYNTGYLINIYYNSIYYNSIHINTSINDINNLQNFYKPYSPLYYLPEK